MHCGPDGELRSPRKMLSTSIRLSRVVHFTCERVEAAKARGNKCYQNDNLELAAQAYEEALDHANKGTTAMRGKCCKELSLLRSTILCNRAAVRLRQKWFGKAINDCEAAIKVCRMFAHRCGVCLVATPPSARVTLHI